jgi:hypothetical protein
MGKRNVIFLFLLLFLGLNIFLTFNRHSKAGIRNYHSEIWSDKAGYYVYLPAFFIYDFNGAQMPEDIGLKTGNGFSIDKENGIIKTKYTYGVALMQLPFFVGGHVLSSFLGYENDGFSLMYHKLIDLSAVIYGFFGCILLYFFLIRHVSKQIATWTLACIYAGTNVFYYAIFETGMSHIYSFFLFAAFLFLSPLVFTSTQKKIHLILFAVVTGLIIIVRPVNIVFLPCFFLFNSVSLAHLKQRIFDLILLMTIIFAVVFPQLLYWKYLSGHYLYDSYGSEGFKNFFAPRLLHLWFSTNNGLFVFNPVLLVLFPGLYLMRKSLPAKSLLIAMYFIFISWLFASWYDPGYGCAYGSRPYVEYYALWSLPIAFFIQTISFKKYLHYFYAFILFIFIFYNLKMMFSYDGCWYWGAWDWNACWQMFIGKTR